MAGQTEDTAVNDRRRRAEIIRCPVCDELVIQDVSCMACGVVFDREGLIDLLVSVKARTPDPVVVV